MNALKTMHWVTRDNDDTCEIQVRTIGALFFLQWHSALIEDAAILESYLKFLSVLNNSDQDRDDLNEALDFMRKPFEDHMIKILQQHPEFNNLEHTLATFLYPTPFVLLARSSSTGITSEYKMGAPSPILPGARLGNIVARLGPHRKSTVTLVSEVNPSTIDFSKEQPYLSPDILNRQYLDWVPAWYSSKDVELPSEHPLDTLPTRVLVDERKTSCFFKPFDASSWSQEKAIGELTGYRELTGAFASGRLSSDSKVCRLQGLVCDRNIVSGVLLVPFIETEQPGILGTLYCAIDNSPQACREKWADQVSKTVHSLHKAGCVWGDAKPHNVLIDSKGDAWIIDFGRGYTRGWVESEKQGTAEGDLQGLERIIQFLTCKEEMEEVYDSEGSN